MTSVNHRRVLVPVLVTHLAIVVVALAVFQPWRLLTSTTVVEAAPETGRAVLASGTFVSHEHRTTGTAQLISLPDGSVVVRLEQLDTSDGPALHVWLTDQPVRSGSSGWHVFDDGRHVDLGPLKGNRGSQSYAVPAGTDLTGLVSVSVWCARFHVSFGAARLARLG